MKSHEIPVEMGGFYGKIWENMGKYGNIIFEWWMEVGFSIAMFDSRRVCWVHFLLKCFLDNMLQKSMKTLTIFGHPLLQPAQNVL